MVSFYTKGIRKRRKRQNSTINTTKNVPKEHKKPKSQIDKEYYQKNKERKKQQRRERYQQEKKQAQLTTQQAQGKYYGAEAIKVLMSLKQYTELNKEKMKLWVDFNWTFNDCQENGMGIVDIMKLEQVASNLVRDYWKTAKSVEKKGKSWNSISEEQQQQLIKYWGFEKARVENNYLDTAEKLEKQSQEYLKDMELAKFHEERGKVKCECYSCEQKKEMQKEIKVKREKAVRAYEKEQAGEIETEWIRGECNGCGEDKKADSDSGLCRKCLGELGE
jgi:hypothetical protein